MGLRSWRVFWMLSVVTLVFCFVTILSAYGADKQTLDRLETIIQQQQAQIETQQKTLEQLQGEVEVLKGQTAAATVKAATDSPAAVKVGKFSLGWGSTASDGTSEMDLSGTSIVGYSSVADMAGGQLFYNKNTGSLSNIPIASVYGNMDGLGRDERIRYDSPSFSGFVGSASYIADGGGDLAVRYTAQMDAFRLAAAVAYANPGSSSDIVDDQLAGSLSVLHDSGFNGTFAMGTRDNKGAGVSDAGFFYTKFGYRGRWCPLGVTSLSADYGRYSDFTVNGDDADTIGLQMVQDIQEWGSEAYLATGYINWTEMVWIWTTSLPS